MSILVTGATGLVGNNVVRMLAERGEPVRVLVREGSDLHTLDELPVEISRGDVRDWASVERAFHGVDRVIHCAADLHIGWHGLRRQWAVNVDGTRNIADTAMRCGARMVHVSSIDALGIQSAESPSDENTPLDGERPCTYVVTKREGERVVLDGVRQGLDAVIVNPGFMLGPWDWKPSSGRLLLTVAKGVALLAPPGTNSYCDVRDVAAGIVNALEHGRSGERYILAGKTLSYMEALRVFARVTGGRPPLRIARAVTVKLFGLMGDLWAQVTGRETDLNSAVTTMSMLPKNFSSARAQSELGYRTRSIEESAADAWAWFKQHGYAKAS